MVVAHSDLQPMIYRQDLLCIFSFFLNIINIYYFHTSEDPKYQIQKEIVAAKTIHIRPEIHHILVLVLHQSKYKQEVMLYFRPLLTSSSNSPNYPKWRSL